MPARNVAVCMSTSQAKPNETSDENNGFCAFHFSTIFTLFPSHFSNQFWRETTTSSDIYIQYLPRAICKLHSICKPILQAHLLYILIAGKASYLLCCSSCEFSYAVATWQPCKARQHAAWFTSNDYRSWKTLNSLCPLRHPELPTRLSFANEASQDIKV
jgi:hypothetical protein